MTMLNEQITRRLINKWKIRGVTKVPIHDFKLSIINTRFTTQDIPSIISTLKKTKKIKITKRYVILR
jgi:hypothetical protein